MTAKGFTLGTHRAVPPEETLRRISGRLDGFGITRVADITGLDRVGIPVMAAYRPDAWSLAVSMGKGVTMAAAQVSAMMESIELWHAERPAAPLVWGSAAELADDRRVVDWTALAPAGDSTLESTTSTAWIEAASMIDGQRALVPYEVVHTDGRSNEPAGSGWFACTSNGLASGNEIVEAQLHALCELIERDAITMWRFGNDFDSGLIDPTTITDDVCRALLDRFDDAGLGVVLHDATSDVGVPVVHCVVFEPSPDPRDLVHAATGMGCHPAADVAAARALTEAAQSRLTLISGARDDLFRAKYRPPADAAEQVDRLTAVCRASTRAGRAFTALPDRATESLDMDLDVVTRALTDGGFRPWWIDLSRDGTGVAVGRAVVPGLETSTDIASYRPGVRARRMIATVGR